MAKKRLIVPIFISHQGCPYRCVYCDQDKISGSQKQLDQRDIDQTLDTYLQYNSEKLLPPYREIAFYGGTFTGLPEKRQKFLLGLIQPYIDKGLIHSVRLSTHPQMVDPERLSLLKNFGVETIELGVQSTDKRVLELSGRDDSVNNLLEKVNLIKKYGFQLGIQLMAGLPGDTKEKFQTSVNDVINLKPNFVRLYPALVIRKTKLHDLYLSGKYIPWSIEKMIESLKIAVLKFRSNNIRVIRIGLHPEPSLFKDLVAGPFDPGIRDKIESQICLDQMLEKIKNVSLKYKKIYFKVPSKKISDFVGYRKENINKLRNYFPLSDIKIQADNVCQQLELIN